MTADRKHAGFIPISSSLSSCGKRKGGTWDLAINQWDLIAWAYQGLTVLKRAPCPRQNHHHINPKGHPETSPQHDEVLVPQWTRKVQLQCGLTTCWVNTGAQLPRQDTSTVPTNLTFTLAPSDPCRWWISIFSTSQAHFLGTLLDRLYGPPKHSQHVDKRES